MSDRNLGNSIELFNKYFVLILIKDASITAL